MVRSRVARALRTLSVPGFGVALLVAAIWEMIRNDSGLWINLIETALPFAVGAGMVLAGVLLSRTHTTERIGRIAAWVAASTAAGGAFVVWIQLLIRLESGQADPAILILNAAAVMMAVGTGLGYYATGLRRRTRELETAEGRFRALTENAPFAVVTIDETSTVRFANDAVADLFGYQPGELVGEPLDKVLPEWDPETAREHTVQGDHASGTELIAENADGHEFPVSASFGAYVSGDDHLFTGVVRDITSRKETEARLRDQTARVTRLQEIVSDVATADSRDAGYQRVATGAADLFPCDVTCVLEPDDDRLVPVACAPSETAHDCEPLSTRTSYAGASFSSGEVLRVDDLHDTRSSAAHSTDGSGHVDAGPDDEARAAPVYRSLLSVPLGEFGVIQMLATEPGAFTDRDEAIGVLLGTHAQTALDRLAVEATLRRERDRLQEFANVLSHDVRNPLNVAKGRLDVIRRTGELDEDNLDAIDRAHDRIERLVDDLLALAQQGETVGDTEPVVLAAAARQAWDNVASGTATLSVDVSGEIHVEADRGRLLEVFENLYRNAVEHGSTSSRPTDEDALEQGDDVSVRVGALSDGFYVEDDGPGIPPGERDAVFESGYSTSEDGTGFGLTIVERIVTAHGWSIDVTDGTDGGARFEITGVELGEE